MTALLLTLLAAAAVASPVRIDELAIKAANTEFDGAGHVYKVSGDVKMEVRDLKVNCKEAHIFLTPNDERVERILFTGSVVATRGRSQFHGDKVTYHVATKKLIAEGNTRTKLLLPSSGSVTPGKQEPARKR
jgi:lipopolysaccharide export system protein LptA